MRSPAVLTNREFLLAVSGVSPFRITAYDRALRVVCYH
jgi:hypothetical protein